MCVLHQGWRRRVVVVLIAVKMRSCCNLAAQHHCQYRCCCHYCHHHHHHLCHSPSWPITGLLITLSIHAPTSCSFIFVTTVATNGGHIVQEDKNELSQKMNYQDVGIKQYSIYFSFLLGVEIWLTSIHDDNCNK